VHHAILSGVHTSLAGVSTPHLHCSTSMILSLLLSSRLLGGPLPLLVSDSNLLVLGPCDLESFSPL